MSAVGKFLQVDGDRFLVKGATYGTFAPDAARGQFPPLERVASDFAQMAQYGINTVRAYTVPSVELLDEAARHGLRVMVGIPWPQHIAFLDDEELRAGIRRDVRQTVARLGNHPGVLMFALGNEIPADIVRWHGRERIEAFIRELYDEGKTVAPDATFTYVNFPPTEYLDLPFLDVCAFNVYLHDEASLRKYVARLQHIAGNRPLLLSEAGADSFRQGEQYQADLTSMQLRASFEEGACGAIAFAWTDEWWRGGHPIEDWAFGLVDKARQPKPALQAVARVFADAPFSADVQQAWPKVSVVICAYNAASTMEDCLGSLARLTYPDFEVIIVNDGSNDATGDIARRYPWMRLIEIANGGLSAARNLGLARATGEIVVYTDADVRVESDWLTYLVQPFVTSDVVACGGPNVAPADDPWLARAVALSPGGPTHVLLDDRIAEHVPGCNLAIRRDALLAVGGFNPIYLRAGDDVDVCWRLQARGGKIGFAPSALVWHHHRPSIKAFWRQQVGYGEGEAWLMPHHPDKFVGGRTSWQGRIYSPLPFIRSLTGTRIDSGVWGTALFPSVYHPGAALFAIFPHTPTWLAGSVALALVGVADMATDGWLAASGLGVLLTLLGVAGALVSAAKCVAYALATDVRTLPPVPGRSPAVGRAMVRGVIAWLHFIQPLARKWGWMRGRFSSAEEAVVSAVTAPTMAAPASTATDVSEALRALSARSAEQRFWGESWTNGEAVLTRVVHHLRSLRLSRRIDIDDGWQMDRDVSVPIGPWGWLDLRALVEDHGADKRLLRIGHRLRPTPAGTVGAFTFVGVLAVMLIGPPFDATLRELGVTCAAGVVVMLVWRVSRTLATVRQACTRAAYDVGMVPIGLPTPVTSATSLLGRTRLRDAVPPAHDNA